MDPFDWSILRSTAFFKAMPAEDALSLTGFRKAKVYDKNTTLFRQGEPASAFFVVLSGWVKLYRITPDGLEVVINRFGKQEVEGRGIRQAVETAILLERPDLAGVSESNLGKLGSLCRRRGRVSSLFTGGGFVMARRHRGLRPHEAPINQLYP